MLLSLLAACASSSNDTGPFDGSVPAHDSGGPGDGGDAGSDATFAHDSGGGDAPTTDGSTGTDSGADAGADAATDAGVDAPSDSGIGEAAVDAAIDGAGDGGIVAPVCDGVIGSGEYGGAANQAVSGTQTWYVTWDEINLYIAIDAASVSEANVVYLGVASSADAGTAGLATGFLYDNTDITSLPFQAGLVFYAKATYSEARTPVTADGALAWGSPDATSVQVCAGASTTVREEVIPWSLVGGRPASFSWVGYVAANPSMNPTGYIYGQMPPDDPSGAGAGNETYTKYFAVPDATPGVDGPFADEL